MLLAAVLRLVQSVGIDEQRTPLDVVRRLAHEVQLRPQAKGRVGLHLHEAGGHAEDGGIMTRVAVVHASALQVDEPEEHGDEHTLLVVLSQGGVHGGGYLRGLHVLTGQRAEQATGLCHEEAGGNTLAADVAHAEIERIVLKQVAVQVATHLPGWRHRGKHIDIVLVREHVGHHRLLDVAGNAKLTLNALLGLGGGLQLVIG